MSLSDLRALDMADELCRLQDKVAMLTIERDKLRAALERLIRDYEDEVVGEKAMAARRALATDGK